MDIPEADWKRWRTLREIALERYCEKILSGLSKFQSGKDTPHQRYLKLWKYIRKHDRVLAVVFDNPRRSSAYTQMHEALTAGIITIDELKTMGEETQQLIQIWTRHG